ncbi:hypothetical protein [Sporisorium scitamineum]|uniref:Uncharacterized protein n=1 Tax=Sporisorium scitamineum TaxID=49012 RepID=A0A0F7S5G3_9BASI|nr:hypothetical protein [Sporisorium scitamineum]
MLPLHIFPKRRKKPVFLRFVCAAARSRETRFPGHW